MEGQACSEVLRDLALDASLPKHSIDGFLDHQSLLRKILECYGISLSEESDLLSQWRGYASDGAGFAIGFDRGLVNQLPPLAQPRTSFAGLGPSLYKVAYEVPETTERLRGLFDSARPHIEKWFPKNMLAGLADSKVVEAARSAVNDTLMHQWGQLFSIKGQTFKEEREWRLAVTAFPGSPLYQYRVSRGMLIPYLKYQMPDVADGLCPIAHVVIGPRNQTPTDIVEMILRQFGHANCRVDRSKATYR
jgi:hypothetical protein